jgi:hypothetical protein
LLALGTYFYNKSTHPICLPRSVAASAMPRRPSAFEVSYPGEEQVEEMEDVVLTGDPSLVPVPTQRKRPREDVIDEDLETPVGLQY